MSAWGDNAVNVKNNPVGGHSFNASVIGEGCSHPNMVPSEEQIYLRLVIRAFKKGDDKKEVATGSQRRDLLLDSGAACSVFAPCLGKELGLKPAGGFIKTVRLADGTRLTRLWCEHEVAVNLGYGDRNIPVLFPVKRREILGIPFGWDWDDKYQGTNILGMRGVLSRWMICLTPERVYVFARKNPPSG